MKLYKKIFIFSALAVSLFAVDHQPLHAQTVTSIRSCRDLENINNNLSGNYVLANDILDCNTISNFQPIGGATFTGGVVKVFPFTGSFNGQGHVIKGVTINSSTITNVGLFGVIDSPATVSNVVLDTFNITGSATTGALAATLNSGTISNVIVKNSNIFGSFAYVGGLVGGMGSGTVINSAAINTNVTGALPNTTTGGLVGQIGSLGGSPQIIQSYTIGGIVNGPYAGGLVGYFSASTITNSYSLDHVTGPVGSYLGGLVGGILSVHPLTRPYITNSYAAGVVDYKSGGVVGIIDHTGTTDTSSTYWDTQATGQKTDALTTTKGKTTSQMYQQSTYVGWDFNNVWIINSGGGYPHLRSEIVSISNCQDLQNMNQNLKGLYKLVNNITDCNKIKFSPIGGYQLQNGAIYSNLFSGMLDGQGYTISGLTITGSDVGSFISGLFGFIDNGTVSNLNISSANISTSEPNAHVGILAGQILDAYTKISNVHVQGSVVGDYKTAIVGGLVGSIQQGTIEHSSANATVKGAYTGGLVGNNVGGTIDQSFSMGIVNGSMIAGGLVGTDQDLNQDYPTVLTVYSEISNSYSLAATYLFNTPSNGYAGGLIGNAGSRGSVTNCFAAGKVGISGASMPPNYVGGLYGYQSTVLIGDFWDTQATGQTLGGPSGFGKTTAQMYQLSTFTSAGWDFKNVWRIDGGLSYPHLKWEPYSVFMNVIGDGQGSIISIPFGIACSNGQQCQAEFPARTHVNIQATASSGSIFAGWGMSSCSPLSTTCSVNLNNDVYLIPEFDLQANANLQVFIVDSKANQIKTAGSVTLTSKDRTETIQNNRNGVFNFYNLKSEQYSLVVNFSGYTKDTATIAIAVQDQNRTKKLQIQLVKP